MVLSEEESKLITLALYESFLKIDELADAPIELAESTARDLLKVALYTKRSPAELYVGLRD